MHLYTSGIFDTCGAEMTN